MFLNIHVLCYVAYVSSRGCIWNRCAFCSQACNYGHRYHQRSTAKVISDIKHLQEQYNIQYLNFNDESISPKRLLDISSQLTENNIKLRWLALLRLDKAFTSYHFKQAYKAGLRMISFGLESGSQDTLNLMSNIRTYGTTEIMFIKKCPVV